jgi:hypothetical protein
MNVIIITTFDWSASQQTFSSSYGKNVERYKTDCGKKQSLETIIPLKKRLHDPNQRIDFKLMYIMK